jgi:hypothetical protein
VTCTWQGCAQAAVVELGFGRMAGRLLSAAYCAPHADEVRRLFLVEEERPVDEETREAA